MYLLLPSVNGLMIAVLTALRSCMINKKMQFHDLKAYKQKQ